MTSTQQKRHHKTKMFEEKRTWSEYIKSAPFKINVLATSMLFRQQANIRGVHVNCKTQIVLSESAFVLFSMFTLLDALQSAPLSNKYWTIFALPAKLAIIRGVEPPCPHKNDRKQIRNGFAPLFSHSRWHQAQPTIQLVAYFPFIENKMKEIP